MDGETMEAEEDRDLTTTWQTMGLEDRPVEEARTVTMRTRFRADRSRPEELVGRLPRLLESSPTGTAPELRVKDTLGEGGMGLVELAEQQSVGRDVAVKKVRPDHQSEAASMVLLREGWTTGLLEHPNIVPIYTLGRDDGGDPVIVMKKIEGTSWLDIIDDPGRAPDGFEADDPLELHVEILIQVCNAIHYAHSRGVVHRDLKPENVMLGEFGEVYVLDWGIAVSVGDDASGRLVSVDEAEKPAGTPAYMAPEMVTPDDDVDIGPHTDVFLLGAMLHEVLTGEPPYSAPRLHAIMLKAHECRPPKFDDDVPPELASICRRAMARNPQERFEDVRALRDALYDFRRRRQSRQLATKGEKRLEEVENFLAREQEGEEIDEAELYRAFGECRFAFEQAIEVAGDNRRAVDGLQKALEMMADRALSRDAYKAASLLIADFPRSDETFDRRLEQLEERLAERREDYEELQQIRRDVDVEVGEGSRAVFALIMGVLWTILSLGLAFLVQFDLVEVTTERLVVHIVGMTALVGGVVYAGRDWFFENKLNRKLLYGVILVFGGVVVYRIAGWQAGLEYPVLFSFEYLIYMVSLLLLGVTLDRRLLPAAIPWPIATFVGLAWPEMIVWLFTAANVVTVGLLVWQWWPDQDDGKVAGIGAVGEK